MTIPGHDEKGRFTSENQYGGDRGSPGRPEIYTEEWVKIELEEMIKWMDKENNLYFKDFCSQRRYEYDRLYEAVNKYPRFSGTMKLIKQMQEGKYMRGGLSKKLAEGMCTRALTRMGVFDSSTTVIVKKESDPVSIAVENASGTSKDLVINDSR